MPNKRNKDLIILRGLPGSGKTARAHNIVWEYDSGEIFSTDDYFKDENGDWIYPTVRERHAAHNQLIEEVWEAMYRRVHPIVIDNTNVERWEMWPYVNMAFKSRKYYVLFEDLEEEEEPISLATRYQWCQGSISMRTLRNMELRYEYNVTFQSIFRDPEVRNKWMEMDEKLSYPW